MSQKKKESHLRLREGVVVSHKMKKTVIVEITRLTKHPQYKKIIRNKVRYVAHDEKSEAKMGDKVKITAMRPLSKTKRWRVVEVSK